jgi:hypothetical protein
VVVVVVDSAVGFWDSETAFVFDLDFDFDFLLEVVPSSSPDGRRLPACWKAIRRAKDFGVSSSKVLAFFFLLAFLCSACSFLFFEVSNMPSDFWWTESVRARDVGGRSKLR